MKALSDFMNIDIDNPRRSHNAIFKTSLPPSLCKYKHSTDYFFSLFNAFKNEVFTRYIFIWIINVDINSSILVNHIL